MGYIFNDSENQTDTIVDTLDYIDVIRAELYTRGKLGRNNYATLENLSWNELCDRGVELFQKLKKESIPPKKVYPRCNKCVYENTCIGGMDNENECLYYKRDAPDGGYYG